MTKSPDFKTKSIMCVPMIAAANWWGFWKVLNKKTPAGFTEGDQHLLESLAGLGAMAIATPA